MFTPIPDSPHADRRVLSPKEPSPSPTAEGSKVLDRCYLKGLLLSSYCNSDSQEDKSEALKLLRSLELDPAEPRPGFHRFCKGLNLSSETLKRAAPRLLALAQNQRERLGIAHSIVRSLLCAAAAGLEDPALKRRYLRENITEKELLEVLVHLSSESRTNCVRAMLYLASLYEDVQGFMVAKLNNMLHFVGTPERIAILSELAGRDKDPAVRVQAQHILLGSFDLKQLKDVVNGVGEEKLLAFEQPAVKELLAYSAILPSVRQVKLPERLAETADKTQLQQRLGELIESLTRVGEICLSQSQYVSSPLAKRLIKIINLRLDEAKRILDNGGPLTKQIRAYHCLHAKCSTEFFYGIYLADERCKPDGTHRRWKENEIHEIRQVLNRIPEGRVLFTPKLNTLQRVKSLGQHVLGQRFDNGTIRIADAAVNHPYVKKAYQDQSSLQITLTHELGHSIQLGALGPWLKEKDDGFVFIPGEPAYNFDEFMSLSGWNLINDKRYKIENNGLSVVLDGEHLPLGLPTKLRGEPIMLVYNQGLLLSYRLDGRFSLIDYSRSNPWEDWAEGFCEYIMLPERLILFAPQKFLYFEQEFRKYAAAGRLLRLLHESLAKEDEGQNPQRLAA